METRRRHSGENNTQSVRQVLDHNVAEHQLLQHKAAPRRSSGDAMPAHVVTFLNSWHQRIQMRACRRADDRPARRSQRV